MPIYKFFYAQHHNYKQFYCYRYAYILSTLKHCGCVYEHSIVKRGEAYICNTTKDLDCDQHQFDVNFLMHRFVYLWIER